MELWLWPFIWCVKKNTVPWHVLTKKNYQRIDVKFYVKIKCSNALKCLLWHLVILFLGMKNICCSQRAENMSVHNRWKRWCSEKNSDRILESLLDTLLSMSQYQLIAYRFFTWFRYETRDSEICSSRAVKWR